MIFGELESCSFQVGYLFSVIWIGMFVHKLTRAIYKLCVFV